MVDFLKKNREAQQAKYMEAVRKELANEIVETGCHGMKIQFTAGGQFVKMYFEEPLSATNELESAICELISQGQKESQDAGYKLLEKVKRSFGG